MPAIQCTRVIIETIIKEGSGSHILKVPSITDACIMRLCMSGCTCKLTIAICHPAHMSNLMPAAGTATRPLEESYVVLVEAAGRSVHSSAAAASQPPAMSNQDILAARLHALELATSATQASSKTLTSY